MHKLLIFTGASIGALTLICSTYSILSYARQSEQSYALLPDSLKGEAFNRCYPTTFHSPEEVRYVQSEDGYQYYEAIAKPKFSTSVSSSDEFVQNPYATLYIRTIKDGCKWLNRNDLRSGRLKFMPQSVAIALAKQKYSQIITSCLDSLPEPTEPIECTKQLEVAVNQPPNWAFDQIDYLFPDDEAALNELGVKTDKVLVVKSIEEVESKKKLQQHKIN
jgi:hypothetical protein